VKFGNLFKLLKSAPYLPEKTNQSEIAADYKHWRIRIFYATYVGYVFFYFSRRCFAAAMPYLEKEGYTPSQLGMLASVLYLSYGISKLVSGILSDHANPRYFMAIGLFLTGVANICFGLSSTFTWFAIFMGLNGCFQGWGWAPCTKQLTHWYHQKERGLWWSLLSTAHNLGGYVMIWSVPLIIVAFGSQWKWGFYIPGISCVICSLFLVERMRDVPRTLGLPTIEKLNGLACEETEKEQKKIDDKSQDLTTKEIISKFILTNKYIWLLSISYFFVYVVRTGVTDWGPMYLCKEKGYDSIIQASFVVSWFEVGGFLGTIIAGWGSDYFFKSRRVPIMIICSATLVLAIMAFWYVPPGSRVTDALLMGLIGFLIFGPQMLTGLAAAEFSHKKAAGTAVGFVGCFAYAGAAASAYPLGVISEKFGWFEVFVALMLCCVIICVLLLPMWSAKSRKEKQEKINDLDGIVDDELNLNDKNLGVDNG